MSSRSVNTEGQIYAGASGPGNLIEAIRKYDKDKAGALLYIKRGTTKLMRMIHKQYGKRDVSSFTPHWFDIGQLDNIFTVTTNQDVSTQTGFKRIVMTNDQALQLQPGDVLYVEKLFQADGAEGGTAGEYSATWDAQHRMEEQLLVEERPQADSAGTGTSYVYVRRGYMNDYTSGRIMDEPAANAGGQIMAGYRLLLGGNTHWTGSDAPSGRGKNPETDTNYLQIMRWAFEDQVETSMEKTFLKETPLQINQKLAMDSLAYEMEWRALYGRKTRQRQGNKWRFTTGGLFDYVTNAIDYSQGGVNTTMNWMAFQRAVMAPLFELGGSSSKVAFCSISTFSLLAEMLWNKVQITIDRAWSQKFGFEIYAVSGGGGTLRFVPSWVYGQNSFRRSQMLVLDFGGPYFKMDVMEDLHINKGPNGAGLQLPGQRIKKYEYVTIAGLQRRAKQYHAIIHGLPVI